MSVTLFDFGDGSGPVPAHPHVNGGGWVADSAHVSDSSSVQPFAHVFGNAKVDQSRIFGSSKVYGNASVGDYSMVGGNARIYGDAKISGKSSILGDSCVYGCGEVYNLSKVKGSSSVYGNGSVGGRSTIDGDVHVSGYASIGGKANLVGDVHVSGKAKIFSHLRICSFKHPKNKRIYRTDGIEEISIISISGASRINNGFGFIDTGSYSLPTVFAAETEDGARFLTLHALDYKAPFDSSLSLDIDQAIVFSSDVPESMIESMEYASGWDLSKFSSFPMEVAKALFS